MPAAPSALYNRLSRWVSSARTRVEQWAQTRTGSWMLALLRHGVTVAVIGYLGYHMTQIGWANIWAKLPTTPWFYLLFLALYFLLPTVRSVGYSLIWQVPPSRLFPPLLKSAVYNKEVLSYSGEMYFFSWARAQIPLAGRTIAHHIKDNTIVSSVASTANAVAILGVFLVADLIPLSMFSDRTWVYIGAGVVGGIALIVVGIRFRRSVFALSGRLLLGLFALYFVRLLLLQGLQVTQWAVAMPQVALHTWLTFLSIQIITKRIPLMPSQDLFFMAVGLSLAGPLGISSAGFASVLAVHSVLDKGLGLLLFVFVSWWDRTAAPPDGDEDAEGSPPSDKAHRDAPVPSAPVSDIASSRLSWAALSP